MKENTIIVGRRDGMKTAEKLKFARMKADKRKPTRTIAVVKVSIRFEIVGSYHRPRRSHEGELQLHRLRDVSQEAFLVARRDQ